MNTLPPPHPYCRQHILIAATLPPPHPYCRQYAAIASYCRQSAAMPPGLLPPCRHAARPSNCRQIAARMQSCRHSAAIACLLPPLLPQLPPERLGGNKNFAPAPSALLFHSSHSVRLVPFCIPFCHSAVPPFCSRLPGLLPFRYTFPNARHPTFWLRRLHVLCYKRWGARACVGRTSMRAQ